MWRGREREGEIKKVRGRGRELKKERGREKEREREGEGERKRERERERGFPTQPLTQLFSHFYFYFFPLGVDGLEDPADASETSFLSESDSMVSLAGNATPEREREREKKKKKKEKKLPRVARIPQSRGANNIGSPDEDEAASETSRRLRERKKKLAAMREQGTNKRDSAKKSNGRPLFSGRWF